MSVEVCKDKDIRQMNRCLIGFQHGKKKMKMEDILAEGPLGRDYGDGYKVGREFAFKQTGSKRKTRKHKKHSKKSRKHRK
jgi:hypothetical protein